jgi:electron transport complex protein RnfC
MIGGIRVESRKEFIQANWTIRRPASPVKVYIPLSFQQGPAAVPCVDAGSHVRIGQKIAEPSHPLSVAVHASISGKVTTIDSFPHPLKGEAEAIEIQGDGRNEKMPEIGEERRGWESLSAEKLLDILQDSGIVELNVSMEPLHRKILKSRGSKVHTLILNGCESEPYVTSDFALMMSHPVEILKGAEILRTLFHAERIVIAIQDNKLEAAELLKSKVYFLKWGHTAVKVLPSLYPQGDEIPLIHALFGRKGKVFLSAEEAGVRIQNVATAFAIYEAVAWQKPLYERAVTVGGECVVKPQNVWIRIGTSFEDAIKTCRGLLREPRKVLMNGPMRGIAAANLHVPILPGTQAVLALPKEVVIPEEVEPCIRCNRCVDACPVEISPVMISLAAEEDRLDIARSWGVEYCVECGNCSYVCPAKRPMTELIHYARSHIEQPKDYSFSSLPSPALSGVEALNRR